MKFATACVLLLLCAGTASAQQPRAAVVPESITVGDVFHAAVRVDLREGMTVSAPDSIALIEDVEQAGRRDVRIDSTGGARHAIVMYPLAAWRPGTYELPDITLRLAGAGVDSVVRVALPPFDVLLWPSSARVIRSQVLTLRERAYVEAARVTGASAWRILFVHIAPNILPLSFVYAAIAIGWAIITEASVSFLGFGDSTSVSWGMMLQDAFTSQALSRGQYAWFVPPGICIILIVVAGFFISRGYEEVFMPRLRGR
jgi:hypothetical protein